MMKDSGAALLAGAMLLAPPLEAQSTPTAPAAAETGRPHDPAADGTGGEADILVVGTPADARNRQFAASQPIAILSRQDLERTAAHNVAEALGLLPGVNVVNTGNGFIGGVDGASRGEGQYVSIRGLPSEYTVNLINGVNVAQGQPYSRQVQLSLLPPTGLNTIVLDKASTAAMDGDAIGGTVDFRTPNAFDFKDDFHATIAATGRLESRARNYGDGGLGAGGSAEIARRFGSDGQFGVYLSGYYDSRHYANSELRGTYAALYDGGWGYLVGDAKGRSFPGLDPERNATQTGLDVGVSTGSQHRYGGTLSLDWKPDDATHVYLRGTYARAKTQQDSTLSQFATTAKSYNPIDAAGRYALSVNGISTRLYYETNPEDAELATAALGGEKKLGRWTIAPEGFFSTGHNDRPNHIEGSARINQQDKYNKGQLRPFSGLSIGYGGDLPYPLFTPDTYADLDQSGSRLLARRAGQLTESFSRQRKYGGRLDMTGDYSDLGGILRSVSFGGKVTDSRRRVTNRDWTNTFFANLMGSGGLTWDSLGITRGSYDDVYPGSYHWSIPKIDKSKLFEYFYRYQTPDSFDTCGSLYINNYNCNTQRGGETVYAAYASADLKAGPVQVIPGFRFEHTAVHNIFWVQQSNAAGEQPGYFDGNRTRYNAALPSLFVNYRPSDKLVIRGDTWLSYTRPAFFQLGGGAQRSVGDDGNVSITQGNPDLKAIRAVNSDASAEWRFAPGGYVMLGGYYKHLSHYLYNSGSGQTNSASSGGANQTIVTMPQNGGSGHVYGLEAQARKAFTELPGLLGGLGLSIDATRQWTRVDIGGGIEKPIQNAPDFMANVQLFYQRDGVSFDVIFHHSASYVEAYDYLGQNGWDDRWIRPIQRVDVHAGYDFGHGLKADVSVANIADNYTYWAHIGRHSLAISDKVDSGRTGLLTVQYTF